MSHTDTDTNTAALQALHNINARSTGDRPEDGGRYDFVQARKEHYRRFNLTEAEVTRLALEDLHTRF